MQGLSSPITAGARERERGQTYIRMSAKLLNDSIVKMTGIAEESAGDVVGVLHASKGAVQQWELRPLSKLELASLVGRVQLMDPGMVSSGFLVLDVVLEFDNVSTWNVLGVDRGKDRNRIIVDGADAEEGVGRDGGG
jgi:hypothetical protein